MKATALPGRRTGSSFMPPPRLSWPSICTRTAPSPRVTLGPELLGGHLPEVDELLCSRRAFPFFRFSHATDIGTALPSVGEACKPSSEHEPSVLRNATGICYNGCN